MDKLIKKIWLVFDKRANKIGIKLSVVFIVAGFLGYINQILMARLLGISSYGVFASILAGLAILSAPSIVISPLVTKQVAQLNIKKNYTGIFKLYKEYLILFTVVLIIFQFISFIYGEEISLILSVDKSMLYLIVFIAFSLILLSVSSGVFYGVQKFKIASFIGVLYPALKIILCSISVLIGMEVLGATLGILFAASIAVCYGAFQVFKFQIKEGSTSIRIDGLEKKKILMMLSANTFFAVMLQMDVIVVNYFFGPEEGGIYASAATLGKSVLYLPGGIAIALLATAGSNKIKKNNHQTLMSALVLTGICCLMLACFMYLFSGLIIKLTFGDGYQAAAEFLGWYAFAMCPWALVIVLENYLIALDKYFLTWIYLFGITLQSLSIYYLLSDSFSVLYIVCFLGILIATVGLLLAWVEFGRLTKSFF
jgi:O-antigen/teichoic acid export membrane protein